MARKKYQLEFVIKSSPGLLWEFLTTSNGLANWFADSVDDTDGVFIFTWSGSTAQAQVIESREPHLFRLKWLDGDENEYFEFLIESSEVTRDTILYVTDFADEDELEDQRILWESQIATLTSRIGG